MIREALNKQKGDFLVGDNSLYRLIRGEDPVTNSKSEVRNPDHYQPIQAFNFLQSMLCASFTGKNLCTNDYTLLNLLVILGTGQGVKTHRFFQCYLHQQWFTDANSCIAVFEQAYQADQSVVLDNMECWGTPCSWLSFEHDCSSRHPLFDTRIRPMFDDNILELW